MQTRFVVHRAYNRAGHEVAALVVVAGRHIPFGNLAAKDTAMFRGWPAASWTGRHYIPWPSVAYWKDYARECHATRFERFTVLGETP